MTGERYRGWCFLGLRPIGRTPGFGPGNPRSSRGGPATSRDHLDPFELSGGALGAQEHRKGWPAAAENHTRRPGVEQPAFRSGDLGMTAKDRSLEVVEQKRPELGGA